MVHSVQEKSDSYMKCEGETYSWTQTQLCRGTKQRIVP